MTFFLTQVCFVVNSSNNSVTTSELCNCASKRAKSARKDVRYTDVM